MKLEIKKIIQKLKDRFSQAADYVRNNLLVQNKIEEESNVYLQEVENQADLQNPENPFYEEYKELTRVKKLEEDIVLKNINNIKENLSKTKTGGLNSTNFEFYNKQTQQSLTKKKKNLIHRNFVTDLFESFFERYNKWKEELQENKREQYVNENLTKLENLMQNEVEIKKAAQLMFDPENQLTEEDLFGYMWDLSEGSYGDYGFRIIEEYAAMLANDKSLQAFAEILGHQNFSKKRYQTETVENLKIVTDYKTVKTSKGAICGLTLSGDISSALPSELMLYNHPKFKLYFQQKLLEKKLLSYSCKNKQKYEKIEPGTEAVQVAYDEDVKGPVIICVDTSGSMQGTPEQVAKTITYALTKICMKENRPCYLINFSTSIQVMDLSADKNNWFSNLCSFLQMSFYGGTDGSVALEKAVELLQTQKWKNADVLMLSDLCMDSLDSTLTQNIQDCQEAKTRFFSLVIGSDGYQNVIRCFDQNWYYDYYGDNTGHIKQCAA